MVALDVDMRETLYGWIITTLYISLPIGYWKEVTGLKHLWKLNEY